MSKIFLQKDKGIKEGFTLIETLVAVAILMIAIAGPLTIAEKALSASIYAKSEMTATYLAQDAIEYVKNIVDTNENTKAQSGVNWLSYSENGSAFDLSTCTVSGSGPCAIDTIAGTISHITSTCSTRLYLSSIGYGCTNPYGASSTEFTRYFYLTAVPVVGGSGSAYVVTAIVNWPATVAGGGGVTLTDTIFDVPTP
jgi:prepilin-type N-terminal cleavage/methylation domain-containing protein